MTKEQALFNFWAGFGWKAYEVNAVPTGDIKPSYPYITYSVQTGALDNVLSLDASLWDYGTSWQRVAEKAAEISTHIVRMMPIKIDGGYLYITRGTPFAQHLSDTDDTVKRIKINIEAEFVTE